MSGENHLRLIIKHGQWNPEPTAHSLSITKSQAGRWGPRPLSLTLLDVQWHMVLPPSKADPGLHCTLLSQLAQS